MKALSVILSIHILFLAVAPALSIQSYSTEVKDCKKSCCQADKEGRNSGKQNKNCCNACNPFMVCCNCYAITAQVQGITAPSVFSRHNFSVISENNNSEFSSDAWNPPKAV